MDTRSDIKTATLNSICTGLFVHISRDVLLYTLTTKIIIISYFKKESGKNKLAAYNLIFDN